MSLSDYAENEIADWLGGNGAPGANASPYVKLHTGDPGEDGTANAATETTRKAFSGGASAGGVVTSDAALTWTSVAGTETYSHISMWDASTAGNCLGSGALGASKAVTAGDTFTIASGDATITIT